MKHFSFINYLFRGGGKKLLFLLSVLLYSSMASAEVVDGINYLLNASSKTATVVKLDNGKYSGDIVIPQKITASDGVEYIVTILGKNSFNGCTNLTSVSLPESITSLANACFYGCSSLTEIEIPESVSALYSQCFAECTSLASIKLPKSINSIGTSCFKGCTSLTNIEIPQGVKNISYMCFAECSSLEKISIPNTVTSLEAECFYV